MRPVSEGKEKPMDTQEIREKIKEVIAETTSLDPADISDSASFVEDLDLDSLTMLEIGVNVDYAFDLHFPEEELGGLRTLQDSVDLVEKYMAQKEAAAG
jgi:acyl carrier protein